MIYVTQGHEKSIGPEVFLKSFLLLDKSSQDLFTFIGSKECLEQNLTFLKIPFTIESNHLTFGHAHLKCHFVKKGKNPLSSEALFDALELIQKKDILLNLPTSKDQIFYQGQPCLGHTDFFRKYFGEISLSMVFSSPRDHILLITDHIPLSQVSTKISADLIIQKISNTLNFFPLYFFPFKKVILSGINPHAGEGGLLGQEDSAVSDSLKTLRNLFKSIQFLGPLSGDSLHTHADHENPCLLVYMYHDQGLSSFKEKNGFIGLNITLGLPFLRMSLDHGTAFSLYGRDEANYLGCYYLLKESLKVNSILNPV
jgi:4-hydroxythreonine-4-phosphate dehydrogenase